MRNQERADVLAHVSENLRQLRREAGMSQQALADAAGLSRRMIVGLESGETNISLASLDRLAQALGTSFVQMVSDPGRDSKRIEALAWHGRKPRSRGVLLGSVPAGRETQLWSWSLDAGEAYVAEEDPDGWFEMLLVTEGTLRLELQDETIMIETGDFEIFSSAQPYRFVNEGPGVLRFTRVVTG